MVLLLFFHLESICPSVREPCTLIACTIEQNSDRSHTGCTNAQNLSSLCFGYPLPFVVFWPSWFCLQCLVSWLVALCIAGTILCNWHIVFIDYCMVVDNFIGQCLANHLWKHLFLTNSLWVLLNFFHCFSHCLALRGRTQCPPTLFMPAALVTVSHLLLPWHSFLGTVPLASHRVLHFPSLLIQVPLYL